MEQTCILVPLPIPSLSQPLHIRCRVEKWRCCFHGHTSVVPAIVLAKTVLVWSNHNGPAQRVVGAVREGKERDQKEVVTVHTWASVVMELASPSSSGS